MDLVDKILECDQTSMDQGTNNMKPRNENEHLGTSRTDIKCDQYQKGSSIKKPKRWALAMCLINTVYSTALEPLSATTILKWNKLKHWILFPIRLKYPSADQDLRGR